MNQQGESGNYTIFGGKDSVLKRLLIFFVTFIALLGLIIFLRSNAHGDYAVKGIAHLHDNYSDSLISTQDLAIQAKNNGCKFIAINDHNDCRTTDHSKTYLLPEWSNYVPGVLNATHPHKFTTESEENAYVRDIIDQCQEISQEIGILIIPGEEIVASKIAENCLLHVLSPFYSFDDGYNYTSFQNCNDIESILNNLKNSKRLAGLAHPFLDNNHHVSDDQWHQFSFLGVLHQLNVKNMADILAKYLEENTYRLEKKLPLLSVTGDNDYHKTPIEVKLFENLNSRFTYLWLEDGEELSEVNCLKALKDGKTYATLGNLELTEINYIPGKTHQNTGELKFKIKSVKPKVPSLALNYNLAIYCNGNKFFGTEIPNSVQIKNDFLVPFNIPLPNQDERLCLIIYAFYPDVILDRTKVQSAQLLTSPIIINPQPLVARKTYCEFKNTVFEEKIKMEIAVRIMSVPDKNGNKFQEKWLLIAPPRQITSRPTMIDRGGEYSVILANKGFLFYTKSKTINGVTKGDLFDFEPLISPYTFNLTQDTPYKDSCIDILDWNFVNQTITILTNIKEKNKQKVFDISLDFKDKISNVRFVSEQVVRRYQDRNFKYKLDFIEFDYAILHGQRVEVTNDFDLIFMQKNRLLGNIK